MMEEWKFTIDEIHELRVLLSFINLLDLNEKGKYALFDMKERLRFREETLKESRKEYERRKDGLHD